MPMRLIKAGFCVVFFFVSIVVIAFLYGRYRYPLRISFPLPGVFQGKQLWVWTIGDRSSILDVVPFQIDRIWWNEHFVIARRELRVAPEMEESVSEFFLIDTKNNKVTTSRMLDDLKIILAENGVATDKINLMTLNEGYHRREEELGFTFTANPFAKETSALYQYHVQENEIVVLANAIDAYYSRFGSLPTNIAQLKGTIVIERQSLFVDQWGHPVLYAFRTNETADSYCLSSCGMDGAFETRDDITLQRVVAEP